MDTNQSTLDPNSIIRAFQAVANPNNPKQLIKNADQYLSQCESDPTFSLIMLSLLSQCQYPQTQLQILIHLKTVIKRNWTTKRKIGNGCIISQPIKDQIKQKLVILYRIFWKSLYKEFNEIFKFLARQDFPANYLQLNGFIKEVLESVAGYQLDQVLGAQQLLPYLSLVKVVYKQYGQRRMLHSAQFFNTYCTPTLQQIKIILGKINEAFEVVRAKGQNIDAGIGNKLLECSRKVDKIALYCIQSMVSSLQYNPQILQIISYQIQKIPNLLSLNTPSLQPQIELNILAILQQTSKLQSFFPTSFTEFLHDYLQLITQLLFHSSFSNEKLQKVIIFANKIPFTCFLYYLNKTQFKQSLEYKKDNKVLHEKAQEKCYEVFMGFYAGNRCRVMLEKIVLEVMAKFKRDNQDDQIFFQDAEVQGDGVGELGVYEMIVDLVQTIMNRFKVEAHQFVQQIINHLLNVRNEQINERIVQNMYELILLFPKALQRMRVNISQIMKLMENCYTNKNYDMFCRLVRNYHEYFQDQVLISSFQILVQIISNAQSQAHTVYQSSICIRKLILQHNELQLPLQKISPCISRIFRLIQEYKHTPTHLWNLLNLLIQILKALSLQTILINLQYMTRCIQILTQLPDNNNVIVCALVQLLQNLLVVVQGQIGSFLPQKVYLVRVALKVILADNVDNQEEEITQMSKHQLWLCVIKNLHESYCPEDLKKLLPQLIITLKQGITTSDPSLYLQILQQYLLSNLIKLSSTDLLTLYHQLVDQIQPDNDIRTLMSFFSLSFTFLLINCSANGFQLDQNTAKILLVCISKVKDMHMRISPSINGLRTLIMLQICYMILIVGGDAVFGAFNHVYQNYQQWFWPFITGLELINNKYASKVISIALFQSLNILKDTLKVQIDQNLPFDYVIKLITVHTDPIPVQQSMNTYENSLKLFSHIEEIKSKARFSFGNKHSRKIKTHVNQTLSEYDLRAAYRQQISQLYRVWDWGVDDLQERYSDKMVEKMVQLLDFQNGN